MNTLLLCLCLSIGGGEPDRWLGEDKFKHFFASFVITTVSASGARAAGFEPGASLVAGAAVGSGLGVWKEIRDHRSPTGIFSVRDLVWDFAGVGAAVAVGAQSR